MNKVYFIRAFDSFMLSLFYNVQRLSDEIDIVISLITRDGQFGPYSLLLGPRNLLTSLNKMEGAGK